MDPIEAALSGQGQSVQDPIEAALMNPQTNQKPTQATQQSQTNPIVSNIQDLASAFGHHAMNLPHGGAQLVEHGIAALANKVAPESSLTQEINDVIRQDDQAMAQREQQYQTSTPNSPGAYTGAVAGEIAPFLLSGGLQTGLKTLGKAGETPFNYAVSQVPMLSKILTPTGKIVGAGLQGAAIGATAPVTNLSSPSLTDLITGDTSQPSFWNQKISQAEIGGLTGSLLKGGSMAIGSAAKGISNVMKPVTNPQSVVADALRRWAGENADTIGGQLQNPQELVPGSQPTTAQLSGSPAMVQVEKTLANNPRYKEQFVQRELENNAARWNALNNVAGTTKDLSTAQAIRDNTANVLYGEAFKKGVSEENMTPWLKGQITQLMDRPAMQQAMKEAQNLAQNEGITLSEVPSIREFHYSKMALDDMINRASRTGDNNLVRILSGTKDKLLTVMDKLSPDYADARAYYAKLSQPINTMEAGQQIANKLSTGALDASGKPIMTLPGYRSQLATALKNADFGINPEAQSSLEGIQSDLQRASVSNAIRSPGSDTAFNLQAPGWLGKHLYGENFSGPTSIGKIIGGLLGGGLTGHPILGAGAGYATAQKAGQYIGNRVNDVLAEALLNPGKAAALLDVVEKSNNPVLTQQLARFLLERGAQAGTYSAAREAVHAP